MVGSRVWKCGVQQVFSEFIGKCVDLANRPEKRPKRGRNAAEKNQEKSVNHRYMFGCARVNVMCRNTRPNSAEFEKSSKMSERVLN